MSSLCIPAASECWQREENSREGRVARTIAVRITLKGAPSKLRLGGPSWLSPCRAGKWRFLVFMENGRCKIPTLELSSPSTHFLFELTVPSAIISKRRCYLQDNRVL